MIFLIPIVGLLLGIFTADFIFQAIESIIATSGDGTLEKNAASFVAQIIQTYAYSKYLAIAILACMDSVFGGIAGYVEKKFDLAVFVSGFFGNALLAVVLTFIGEKLNLDLYLAAVFVFGNRMFINFAIIRRYLLNKFKKQDNIIED